MYIKHTFYLNGYCHKKTSENPIMGIQKVHVLNMRGKLPKKAELINDIAARYINFFLKYKFPVYKYHEIS